MTLTVKKAGFLVGAKIRPLAHKCFLGQWGWGGGLPRRDQTCHRGVDSKPGETEPLVGLDGRLRSLFSGQRLLSKQEGFQWEAA